MLVLRPLLYLVRWNWALPETMKWMFKTHSCLGPQLFRTHQRVDGSPKHHLDTGVSAWSSEELCKINPEMTKCCVEVYSHDYICVPGTLCWSRTRTSHETTRTHHAGWGRGQGQTTSEAAACETGSRRWGEHGWVETWEWVSKFNGFLGDSGHRSQCSTYKPCNHSLYIGIIILPHIYNTLYTGHN